MSMFALGAQQPGQTVDLLLRPAAREDLMQIAIAALRRLQLLSEMPDHHAPLRLYAVLLEVSAQIADHLPVFVGEFETFLARERTGKILGPVIEIEKVTLGIGHYRMTANIDNPYEWRTLQHESVSLLRNTGEYITVSLGYSLDLGQTQ